MKNNSKSKYFSPVVVIVVMGIALQYTHTAWLRIAEIIIISVTFLGTVIDAYNSWVKYKQQKVEWEKSGDRIKLFLQLAQITGVGELSTATLHAWRQWVTEHPERDSVREALLEICAIATGPSRPSADPAVRDEAQRIVEEHRGSSSIQYDSGTEPSNGAGDVSCGSCGNRMTYKGDAAPVMDVMKGDCAMWCSSCGKYVCMPCIVRSVYKGDISMDHITECMAQVMTRKGKCPCCSGLSVSSNK